MNETNSINTSFNYKTWLSAIKHKIRTVQIKAALSVNTEMLRFYWELGADIVEKQKDASWGDKLIKQLSSDLLEEFPGIKGFSERNLKYIRQWYLFYTEPGQIGQQLVAQFTQIPWGHNIAIVSKCKSLPEASFYIQRIKTVGKLKIVRMFWWVKEAGS